jgi:hypothetical protein
MIQNENYYNDRMALYGFTPEQLQSFYVIPYTAQNDDKTYTEKMERREYNIFAPNKKGIEIIPVRLNRRLIKFAREGEIWKNKIYSIIRLSNEVIKPDGSTQKYIIPKGQGTPPLIPPAIIDAYEAKAKIKTLYITEGYFKAMKATTAGLFTIGLISITCMIDKTTGKLHGDIIEIVKTCKVDRLVWLTDADCRSISKDITDETDLYKRVYDFYNSVFKFQDLCSSLEDTKLYFAHVAEDLDCKSKGLDDLLINNPDQTAQIIKEANQFDRISAGAYIGTYFVKFAINYGLAALRNYFLLNDVTLFYLHHVEKRPELKGKKFRFHGSLYSYDLEKGTCILEIPKSAADYFRVGDQYFEYINIPNRYSELTRTFHARQKATIRDDNGPDIFRHISKYKSFCNTPDHLNYQRIISNCFNTYHPFMHTPESGDCPGTLNFLKHIFGSEKIQLTTGESVERWQLGLDYLTLLYKKPQMMLPILCLVSKERQTGKTTFAKWLKILFTENMAIVGNADFENAFNAHWITKLLVCVDETKIDKDHVVEKIKSLSTATFTMLNSKGRDQIEVEIFLKFILLSNNEDNFINISKDEIRFWVIKVPVIENRIMDLEADIMDEIPAFLHLLNTRKMVTKYEERHWFKTDYLRTETLTKIQDNSAPTLWKIIKSKLETFFDNYDISTLEIPFTDFKNEILKGYHNRYEDGYIKTILKDNGYTLGAVKRGTYPRETEIINSSSIDKKVHVVHFHNRVYTFLRENFTNTQMSSLPIEIPFTPPPPPPPKDEEFTAEQIEIDTF